MGSGPHRQYIFVIYATDMFYCDLNLIVPTNVRWSILHVWWNGNVTLANMEFMAYVMMVN